MIIPQDLIFDVVFLHAVHLDMLAPALRTSR